jgi:hypothetical protein
VHQAHDRGGAPAGTQTAGEPCSEALIPLHGIYERPIDSSHCRLTVTLNKSPFGMRRASFRGMKHCAMLDSAA